MAAASLRLEQLFSRCDTTGSGLIGIEEFQDLCAGFGIQEVVHCMVQLNNIIWIDHQS